MPKSEFESRAEESSPGFLRELVDFLRHNQKGWLTPIVVMLVLLGVLVLIGGSAAAPFIYTLF
jgi:hypothetical protein